MLAPKITTLLIFKATVSQLILALYIISLIKMSVALYSLIAYLGGVRSHFPKCHENSWMENKAQ